MKDIFLLDLDETLLDFRRGEREQLARALKNAGMAAGERELSRFHEINDGLWKKLERGELDRKRLTVLRFEMLFAEFSFAGDAEKTSADYFCGMKEAAYLFEGAKEFLEELCRRGRIFFVTNGALAIQRSRLKKSGLGGYAVKSFISEEVGFNKPSPQFALAVERGIEGYARERAVWLGDSLTSDMACAKSAGIDFILFAPAGAPQGYGGLCARTYPEALELFSSL